KGKDLDFVPERVSKDRVATGCDGKILNAVHLVGYRRRVHPGVAPKSPQDLSGLGIERIEIAVTLADKYQAACRRQSTSDQGLVRLLLPQDLSGRDRKSTRLNSSH